MLAKFGRGDREFWKFLEVIFSKKTFWYLNGEIDFSQKNSNQKFNILAIQKDIAKHRCFGI